MWTNSWWRKTYYFIKVVFTFKENKGKDHLENDSVSPLCT